MPSRKSWPKGLRIVFLVTVLGLIIGLGQVIYFVFIARESYPFEGLPGVFTALDLTLTVLSLLAGAFSRRRLFGILILLESCLSGFATLFFNFEIMRALFPNILSQPLEPATYLNRDAWYYCWNAITFGTNCLIAFYICYYEFAWFRGPHAPEGP